MTRTREDIQDELLVLQCQEGDRKALEALITRWQPKLLRFACRLTSEREAAKDVAQDAWLAVVRGIRRLDDPARFRSWAYRIVSNKCSDWIRRRVVQRDATNELGELAQSSSATASIESDTNRLQMEMKRLPQEQRTALSLHYLDGMSIAEISRVLGVAEGTVKSRLFHARNRLKQAMERTES